MESYKNILFPTDLSEGSKKIAENVKLMAEKFGAEINVLYVSSVGHYYSSINLPAAGLTSFEEEVMLAAEGQLDDFAEEHFEGMNFKTDITAGNPADEIIEYARRKGIDLIIMGHSRVGLERVLLGSVAHRIVKLSPIPVMIIRVEH
ncbi:universal stress protein [Thermodesulfobacteriota bacterium]